MNSNSPQRQKKTLLSHFDLPPAIVNIASWQHSLLLLASFTCPCLVFVFVSLDCLFICLWICPYILIFLSFYLSSYVFVFPGCAAFLSKSLSLLLSVCSSHHNAHLPLQPLTCLDLASPGCAAPPSHGTAHAGGRLWNISALLWIRRCLDAWSFPHRQDCRQVDCGSPAPPGNGREWILDNIHVG